MKTFKYMLTVLCALTLFSSCKKEENIVKPSSISDVQTFSLPGKIGITWKRNEPVSFEYIKVTYFDQLEKKEMVRLASQYADTILIPNTRAKFGDYSFTLQPFSVTGTAGEEIKITGKSEPAPKTMKLIGTELITLKADKLYTDAQEPTEGDIAGLIDGKNNTYFHAAWSVDKGPMPHYIVVDLGKKVNGIKFTYVTRDNAGAGNHPKLMDVFASNIFDPNSPYVVTGLKKVASLSGLPNGKAKTYNSAEYYQDWDQPYQYIWFQVKETHGGTDFFALAELSISELKVEIIDPEAP